MDKRATPGRQADLASLEVPPTSLSTRTQWASKVVYSPPHTIPTQETHNIHKVLSQLESDASILAQENIFPNIADRKTAYTQWPSDLDPPDYIVFDSLNYLFYYEPVGHTTRDALFQFLETGNYGLQSIVNGFMVMKKDYEGPTTTLSRLRFQLDFDEVRKSFVSWSLTCCGVL